VGGNSFQGDKLLARVNSGEMILNKRQQASLFKQLNNGGGGVQRVEVYGELKANKNSFAAEVTTAQKVYDKKVKVASIGRS
jgi:hypothetical protein